MNIVDSYIIDSDILFNRNMYIYITQQNSSLPEN